MRLRIWLATFLLVLSISTLAYSQTVQGVVTGTVTDPTGAVLPKASVTLTNSGTNLSQTTTTAQDGSFRFPLVPPGSYAIDVRAANFAELKVSNIVVQASQTVPLNLKMQIAAEATVVEVTEQEALVQIATSELSTQISRETIQNAPLVDRDVFSTLPFLAPQVTPGLDLMPTSGGARESGTSYLLNGGDDNDNFSEGAVNIHPPLESVQDFSILTNQMSAQYGRGFGAVVSANQASGGNRFHGAIYEFNRNASLNANDFFYNRDYINALGSSAPLPTRPKYIKNQYGGIISGPIRKDKTFFAFAYDRNKLLAGSTSANNFVPTNAALNYVKANGGPIAQAIIKAAPPVTSDLACPGTPGTGGSNNVGCLSFFDPQTDTQDAYYGRVDQNFGSSDRLSFTANIFREAFVDKFGGGGLTTNGPINGTTTNHFHQLSLDETHTFSASVLNEVTLSHNRHYNVFIEGTGKETTPDILIDNQNEGCLAYHIGGPFEGGQVQGFTQDRWGLSDSVSWKKGDHSFKFGGGGQYGILYRNWDLGLPGQYEFGELVGTDTPASTGTQQSNGTIAGLQDQTLSNFTHDFPYFQETSIDPRTGAQANAYRHYMYKDFYGYAQDDWKVTRRLTLNLGLRWDRYGAPTEAHNIIAQFTNISNCNIFTDRACIAAARVNPVTSMWPTQNHDFGPRFGFAFDPSGNGKMAIRGGFGISYDRIFDNIWSNGAWNPPFYALLDFDASSTDEINYSVPASIGSAYNPNGPNGPIPYPGKRVSVRTMDVNMRDSSGQNFYLGVEREVLRNMLVRVNYQGALGRHLPMLENLNRYDGAGYGVSSKSSLTVVRPNALYTGFNYRANTVSSNYHALVVEAQKRMGHGLQFQTGYTFSKLLDVNSELFAGCSTIGGSTAPYYFITNTNQRQTYGRAAFDHRHAYKFSVTYEEPFFKGKGFLGETLGGWSIGSIFQLYSGHPIDITTSRAAIRARDAGGNLLLDQNGVPFNVGGDYNLDGVTNDHPVFVGPSIGAFYSGGNPADGIFVDTNKIGCGEAGVPSTFSPSASSSSCPSTPNKFFVNPAYPSGATPYLRYGTLGRDVFEGPRFMQLDLNLSKTFKFTETTNLKFTAAAQNLANHPDFDCVDSSLNSATFGKATCLAQRVSGGLGAPASRVMTLGLRLGF